MPQKLSFQIDDIEALAAILKSPRARKLLQAAVKEGRAPTLSVAAAITASLVSAAAKENETDPLAALQVVDDFSEFGEICLPGQKYAEVGHDHEEGTDHASHDSGHDGPSWLADRFTSRFANKYARDHDEHDGGEHDIAMHKGLVANHDHSVGHQAMSQAGSGQGEHCDAPAATAAISTGHEHHAKQDSEPGYQHHEKHNGDNASAHAGHQVSTDHSSHASSMAHAGHGVDTGAVSVEHSGHFAPDLAADISSAEGESDLDHYVAALADESADHKEHATSATETHDAHHDHGVTLAVLDSPMPDDLSLAISAVAHI